MVRFPVSSFAGAPRGGRERRAACCHSAAAAYFAWANGLSLTHGKTHIRSSLAAAAVVIPGFGAFLLFTVTCLCAWQLRRAAAGPAPADGPRHAGASAGAAPIHGISLINLSQQPMFRARARSQTPRGFPEPPFPLAEGARPALGRLGGSPGRVSTDMSGASDTDMVRTTALFPRSFHGAPNRTSFVRPLSLWARVCLPAHRACGLRLSGRRSRRPAATASEPRGRRAPRPPPRRAPPPALRGPPGACSCSSARGSSRRPRSPRLRPTGRAGRPCRSFRRRTTRRRTLRRRRRRRRSQTRRLRSCRHPPRPQLLVGSGRGRRGLRPAAAAEGYGDSRGRSQGVLRRGPSEGRRARGSRPGQAAPAQGPPHWHRPPGARGGWCRREAEVEQEHRSAPLARGRRRRLLVARCRGA